MIFWIAIGVAFYNLAGNYGKNKFLYLGIGIGITIIIQLLVGFLYGLILSPTTEQIEQNKMLINIVALVISGIVTYVVYRVLKNKVEKEYDAREDAIQSFGADVVQNEIVNDNNN